MTVAVAWVHKAVDIPSGMQVYRALSSSRLWLKSVLKSARTIDSFFQGEYNLIPGQTFHSSLPIPFCGLNFS